MPNSDLEQQQTMKRLRMIYTMLMLVVYMAATSLSSISMLLCDHHKPHSHEVEHHDSRCVCKGLAFEKDCCNHVHPVLGDNHTDYIVKEARSDSRASQLLSLLLAPALVGVDLAESLAEREPLRLILYDDGDVPLLTASASVTALRAPPVFA